MSGNYILTVLFINSGAVSSCSDDFNDDDNDDESTICESVANMVDEIVENFITGEDAFRDFGFTSISLPDESNSSSESVDFSIPPTCESLNQSCSVCGEGESQCQWCEFEETSSGGYQYGCVNYQDQSTLCLVQEEEEGLC